MCVFSIDQVEKAFSGRYKEVNRETQQWYPHTLSIPEPRPGMVSKHTPLIHLISLVFIKLFMTLFFFLQCITNASRQMGFKSSLDMPDKVLNFVKDHFLMDSPIKSQPVLFTHTVRYTQIAVHHVQGLHRAYDVMFIGTGMREVYFVIWFVMFIFPFFTVVFGLFADDGRLQKAVNVGGTMHIIEEISLFLEPQPVQHIELDSTKVCIICIYDA